MNPKTKSLVAILIIIVVFILSSYFAQKNQDKLEILINTGISGLLLYIFVVVIAEVIAPITAMPLLPIVSNTWGWLTAAITSIIGWTLGAWIAFAIARKYGVPLVKKFIPLKKLEKIEKRIPQKHLFWGVVFLRISIPVDILSYTLGLFTKMKTYPYLIATLIGVTPFAFIFAYAGTLPIGYQIIAAAIAAAIFLISYFIFRKKKEKR